LRLIVSAPARSVSPWDSFWSTRRPRIDSSRSCASPAVEITNTWVLRRAPPEVVKAAQALRSEGARQACSSSMTTREAL
jgi:hypothetical protein